MSTTMIILTPYYTVLAVYLALSPIKKDSALAFKISVPIVAAIYSSAFPAAGLFLQPAVGCFMAYEAAKYFAPVFTAKLIGDIRNLCGLNDDEAAPNKARKPLVANRGAVLAAEYMPQGIRPLRFSTKTQQPSAPPQSSLEKRLQYGQTP